MNGLKPSNELTDLEALERGLASLLSRSQSPEPECDEGPVSVAEWDPFDALADDEGFPRPPCPGACAGGAVHAPAPGGPSAPAGARLLAGEQLQPLKKKVARLFHSLHFPA